MGLADFLYGLSGGLTPDARRSDAAAALMQAQMEQIQQQIGAFPQEQALRLEDLQADIGSRRLSQRNSYQQLLDNPARLQSDLASAAVGRQATLGRLALDRQEMLRRGPVDAANIAQSRNQSALSLAQAELTRVQTQDAVQSLGQATKWAELLGDPEAMQEFLDKQKAAQLGMKLDDYQAMQRGNVQMDNSVQAMRASHIDALSSHIEALNQNFSSLSGKPVDVFGGTDVAKAADLVDRLRASDPSLADEDAVAAVARTMTNLAQQKFFQMNQQGPPLPPSFNPRAAAGLPPTREEMWNRAAPTPLGSSIMDFFGGRALQMTPEEAQAQIAAGMGQG